MRSARALCSMLAVVSMVTVACSSDSAPSTDGGAGSTAASSQGGGSTGQSAGGSTTSSAGQAGASGGVSSSGAAGQAGSSASGGKTEGGGAGAGGTSKAGNTTQPGGTTASGGRAGSGGTGTTGPSSTAGGTSAGSGGTGTASTTKGGTTGSTGGTGAGGTGGTTSSGTSTEAVKSEGCGKTPTLKGGKDPITIQSSRKYFLRIPDGYDNTHPYRLVVTYAESGSSAQSVMERNYFRLAGFDPKNTVFVAPDAAGGTGQWSKTDVDLTDKILEQVEGDLCIDKTRIFASGFSFGGGMAIAIACNRADVFRGVAFWSGADLTGACPSTLTKPIAYWASQASGDASGDPTPMSGRTFQKRFAEVNGCTADPNAIVFPAAGKPHTCTNYKNCSEGHPTIYCVFNGGHGWEPVDPGQSTSWAPKEAWAFITQF